MKFFKFSLALFFVGLAVGGFAEFLPNPVFRAFGYAVFGIGISCLILSGLFFKIEGLPGRIIAAICAVVFAVGIFSIVCSLTGTFSELGVPENISSSMTMAGLIMLAAGGIGGTSDVIIYIIIIR